ncbi:MAG: SDR family oxidoreductase [Clostridia bacterium]|nr:SDR family oxidoreductase [Clostridia bacterium]
MKVAVITGGSSGIGLACCRTFREKGYKVYECSRRENTCESGIIHLQADVTDEESIRTAFNHVFETEGRIDVLVNNAGFGIAGSIEYTDLNDAKRQFDVNFFGTVVCIQQVLPFMRKQGFGSIVNISSMAVPLAIPFQAFYSASKAAINSLTLSLANEVRPFGISVRAVMPGDVKTGFTAAREKTSEQSTPYDTVLAKSLAVMEHDEQNGMPPQAIAEAVFKAATKKNMKPLSTKGAQYHLFAGLSKVLPTSLVNRIVGMIYAK